MSRDKAGLEEALEKIPKIREEFWKNVKIPGTGESLNAELEKAGRVADFLECGELMCRDALNREESCGGHFREEYQFTEEDDAVKSGYTNPGEAKRRDEEVSYVAAWEYTGDDTPPNLHREELVFENVKQSVRSYK